MSKIYIQVTLLELAERRWSELTTEQKKATTIFDLAYQIQRFLESKCNRFDRRRKIRYNDGILEIDEKYLSSLQPAHDIIELERRKQ